MLLFIPIAEEKEMMISVKVPEHFHKWQTLWLELNFRKFCIKNEFEYLYEHAMHEQLSTGYMQKSFHKNKVLNNVQIFRSYG